LQEARKNKSLVRTRMVGHADENSLPVGSVMVDLIEVVDYSFATTAAEAGESWIAITQEVT